MFLKELDDCREKARNEREELQTECDLLKEKNASFEDSNNSQRWEAEKEIALLHDKIKFAEYQRDQTKKELEDSERQLQRTISQLKKVTEKSN